MNEATPFRAPEESFLNISNRGNLTYRVSVGSMVSSLGRLRVLVIVSATLLVGAASSGGNG
jgi:hypothetical protein